MFSVIKEIRATYIKNMRRGIETNGRSNEKKKELSIHRGANYSNL